LNRYCRGLADPEEQPSEKKTSEGKKK